MKKSPRWMLGLPGLEECGDATVLKFCIGRYSRDRTRVRRQEISLPIERWQLRGLLLHVAAMHERDRQRLAKEASRIESEVRAVTQPKEVS